MATTAHHVIPPEVGDCRHSSSHTRLGGQPDVGAQPVVLLRYQPGITGQTARVVRLVPPPPENQAGVDLAETT